MNYLVSLCFKFDENLCINVRAGVVNPCVHRIATHMTTPQYHKVPRVIRFIYSHLYLHLGTLRQKFRVPKRHTWPFKEGLVIYKANLQRKTQLLKKVCFAKTS